MARIPATLATASIPLGNTFHFCDHFIDLIYPLCLFIGGRSNFFYKGLNLPELSYTSLNVELDFSTSSAPEMTRRLESQNRLFARDCVGWEYYDGNLPLFLPDKPLTPENMEASSQLIMGRFYRFWYMFLIGMSILIFQAMLFPLFNIRSIW